jgi:site-specific recombinase XerD
VQRCLKVEQDRSFSDNSMKELRRYLSEFSSYCQGKNIYFADELTPAFIKTYTSTSVERPFPKIQQSKQEILSILPVLIGRMCGKISF